MTVYRKRECFSRVAAGAIVVLFATIPLLAVAQSPSPSATPSHAPASLGAPSDSAAQRVDAFVRAWAAVRAYSATVTVFERKDTAVQNVVFNYDFRKPSSVTVHVAAGPNAGVTLTWDGGTTVTARRGSGLLGLFKRTLPLHDPLATTIRGSSINQLSFGAMLLHTQEAGKLSEAPGDVIDGLAAEAVSVTVAPATSAGLNAGLTREVLDLSPITHLPMRVLGFDGETLVRKIDFSNVTLSL